MTVKTSLIDSLKALFPGDWKYLGLGTWEGPFIVHSRAHGQWPADYWKTVDDLMVEYVRADTGELIKELEPRLTMDE
jgi:hypothetical protein